MSLAEPTKKRGAKPARAESARATREGRNLLSLTVQKVDSALAKVLERIGRADPGDGPEEGHVVPGRLLQAMRYAVLSPGKRLRPALVFGGARAAGIDADDVLPPACAVEMVHAYSLVHDDLPMLDDDDLRRGLPTCHRAFDEATALLAGDALLTEAMALLADGPPLAKNAERARPRNRVEAVRELARASGAAGMVGGQYDDIFPLGAGSGAEEQAPATDEEAIDPKEAAIARLVSVHRRKTGRLIQASAALGAIWAGAGRREVEALREFGANVGLAFQIVDDVLDSDGIAKHRGAAEARAEAVGLTERGIRELERFGRRALPLAELARALVERSV